MKNFGDISQCEKCDLHKYRKNVVIGKGSLPSDILFIGEAPGKTEDYKGKPFVGVSGKLLDKMLDKVKEETRKDFNYYITNTVFCRPTDRKNGKNRQPTSQEVLACRENLETIVELSDPELIIFLGKVAEKYYYRHYSDSYNCGMIYHPAYLVRGGGISHPRYPMTITKLTEFIKEYL